MMARENATLRQEILRRGLATVRELDECGYVSHAELDSWEQDGEFEEAVKGLRRAWDDALHPRGRTGEWRSKDGAAKIKRSPARVPWMTKGQGREYAKTPTTPSTPHFQTMRAARNARPQVKIQAVSAKQPEGPIKRITRHGKPYTVYPTPAASTSKVEGSTPDRMSAAQLRQEASPRQELEAAGHKRIIRMEGEARKASAKAARHGDHATSAQKAHEADQLHAEATKRETLQRHGAAELYGERTKQLEKRIKRDVRRHAGERVTPAAGAVSRGPHDLSAAEVHFNDAGKISQKTLLAYAEEAATKPTTAEMYRNKQGNWHESRKALHADIIDSHLRERNDNGSLSRTNPYLKPPSGAPTVLMTGGGYASGKGSVLKMLEHTGQMPDNAVVIDPDVVKAELPEFGAAAGTDPESNLRAYSEAWDVSQQVAAAAREKGLNVVVDGITDTHADEVAAKIKAYTDAGYENPSIHYVTVPTEEALKRAQGRAQQAIETGDVASQRMIPEVIMRAVHRDVSATIPGVMARAKEMGANVNVYDTDQGKDEVTGQFRPPKLIASADASGHIVHQDSTAYQRLLHKASETIPVGHGKHLGDTGAPKGVWNDAGADVSVDPNLEREAGARIEQVLPAASNQKLPGISDPAQALTAAKIQGLPALQQLLDLGAGVGRALGARINDASANQPFEDVAKDVHDHMDEPHVIIAPTKSLRRLTQKLAADDMTGDASEIQDLLRATVTVPTADQLPDAISAVTKQLDEKGWTVERVKNRLADGSGSQRTPTGYGDIVLYARVPPDVQRQMSDQGLVGEIQINTNPMWYMKEAGSGHDFYGQERQVRDLAASEGRRMTDEEKAAVKTSSDASAPLYDRAWGASLHGGTGTADAITGDQQQTLQALKQIQRDVASILSRARKQTAIA